MRAKMLVLAAAWMAFSLPAQLITTRVNLFPASGGDPLDPATSAPQAAEATAAYEAQVEIAAARQRELAEIYAKDPWRKLGDATNRAYGKGWVEFQGIVQESGLNGVLFRGAWGQVLTVRPWMVPVGLDDSGQTEYETSFGDELFFVEDFPYLASGRQTYGKMLAWEAGTGSYTNADGETLTLRRLIYGTPCVKLWTAAEIAAAKAKQAAQKQAVEDRVLRSNRVLADQGDPYGLCRMGERYRDGDGVPKDSAKARDYLSQAVAAGSPSAADELLKLDQATNPPAAP